MSTTNAGENAENPNAGEDQSTEVIAGPPAIPPALKGPKSPLATAAMVVGIVAMVFAVIPGLSFVAFLPAITAAILGIIALATKKPRRGRALSGVILGAVALIVAIIVSVSAIAAGVGGASDSDAADDEVTSQPADEPAEEIEEEVAEPEVVEAPADVVYQGTGDSILPIGLVDGADQVAVATITHAGARNFAIWSYGDSSDLVVNEIGAYSGTTRWTAGPSVIVVSADGNWSISVG